MKISLLKSYTSRRERIYDIILALILSVSTVCMTRVRFNNNVWGSIDENHFDKFGISAIILGLILYFAFRMFILFLDIPIKECIRKVALSEQKTQSKKKIICLWAVIIFVAWLPYYLSYYPGGVYADTFGSIRYFFEGILTNRHPLLYTKILGLFLKTGIVLRKDITWSIGLFSAFQMLLLECEFLYFVFWMLYHGINRFIRVLSSIFFVFFPVIPLYAMSVWKDTPFCMSVLFWMMFVVDLYLEINNGKFHIKTFVGFGVGIFLTAFTRNNGIYVVMCAVFILILILFSRIRTDKMARFVMVGSVMLILMVLFIQGPVYNKMGVIQTEIAENLGIPLQQIGAVVAYDGIVTEEQKEIINAIIPYENVKEHYTPTLVDSLKWYAGLDGQYLSEHKFEFFRLWFQLFTQNPVIYVQSYLMATLGFWNIDVSTSDAYVQNFMWNNDYGVVQKDYFYEWFGFSFQHFVNPRHYISSAWFFWIFFIAAWYSMKHYGEKSIFLFVPQLGVWLTLMLATPIAVSLRYMASALFTLPFAVIVPLLLEKK